jgi:hypothetical protein
MAGVAPACWLVALGISYAMQGRPLLKRCLFRLALWLIDSPGMFKHLQVMLSRRLKQVGIFV